MGVSEKPQLNKEWVIAGIQLRAPLKSIRLSSGESKKQRDDSDADDCSTTPTSEDSRIPARVCPPPPRKRKSTSAAGRGCSSSSAKEFFCPPDLDTVFIRRHVA